MRRIYFVFVIAMLCSMRSTGHSAADSSALRCRIDDVATLRPTLVGEIGYLSSEGNLYAADLKTCDINWAWSAENEVIWFATSDNAVFAIDDVRGAERGSRITALDAKSGDQSWSITIEFSAWTIYLHEHVLLIQGETSLIAVDAGMGHRLWKMPFVDPAFASDEFAHGFVFVFSIENIFTENEIKTVHAIDVKTGAEKWQFAFEPSLLSFTIPTSEDIVLFDIQHFANRGFEDVTYAFRIPTGELLWKVRDRQVLFLGTSDSDGFGMHMDERGATTIHKFGLEAGVAAWTVPVGFLPNAVTILDHSLVLIDYEDMASFEDFRHRLYAIDRMTGMELWSEVLVGPIGSYAVQGVTAYWTQASEVIAIDLLSGETIWSEYVDYLPNVPDLMTATEDAVLVSDHNDSVYVFDP